MGRRRRIFPAPRRGSKAQTSCVLALVPFALIAMALSWCGRILGCRDEPRATREETKAALVVEEPRSKPRTAPSSPVVADGAPAGAKASSPKSGAKPAVKPAPAQAPEPARTRYYFCRDGSTSLSCVCGQKKNGCCSHHGGVAGCEP